MSTPSAHNAMMAMTRAQSTWKYSLRSNIAASVPGFACQAPDSLLFLGQVRLELWLGRQRPAVLFREEGVENVVGHQCRIRSVNAVFQEDHPRNLRLIARRKEDEPAVVLQVLVGPALRRRSSLV